jgi:hypothetical protein
VGEGDLGNPDRLEVKVTLGDGTIYIAVGAAQITARLEPKYLRYLYILAWADGIMPFHVPIEVKPSLRPAPGTTQSAATSP